MKVRTQVLLDEEVKKVVQEYFEKTGMSMSGFINSILTEFAKEIQGQPVKLNKKLSDLTLKEYGDLIGYWFKKASE